MCEPTTIMLGLSLAGAAVSAYGQYQQGQTSEALGEYNAKVAENNAATKELAAQDAQARGGVEEDRQRTRTRQALATQRAAFAASGDTLSDISTQNILGDTAAFGEEDALTIRSNAAREAWGIRIGATNDLAQAQSDRFQGKSAAQAGLYSAGGTLLTGASRAYDQSRLRVR